MRVKISILFSLCLFLIPGLNSLSAQEDTTSTVPPGDTTVYQVVEEMPRFPGCEQLDTTLAGIQDCAQKQLLAFVYGNIVYPLEARQNGDEGTAVVNFIVEKDGTLSNANILRDIGGGAGLEVMRVINLMNQSGIRWIPGKNKGETVRVSFNLPVRFKLEEAPPYTLIEGDTVYTSFDTPLTYKGGNEALIQHINEVMEYPPIGNDSCQIGTIDVTLIVEPDGKVRVLDMVDYNDLGFDFWYEATGAITSTIGQWEVATYEGRKVPASYDVALYFEPTDPACGLVIDDFKRANELANEGAALFNEGSQEEGIAKMSEAIDLFPDNASFLAMRGQAFIDMNRLEEACQDLTRAQEITLTGWYKNILPIICR